MAICGFAWKAPWIPPPHVHPAVGEYLRKSRPAQKCILPKGHDGDHRSISKVICKNNEEK